MHLVQFLLQVLHLAFDGLFPQDLLMLLLLAGDGLVGDPSHFQEVVQHLFDELRPGQSAVFGQDGIALLVFDLQPGRHGAGSQVDGVDLIQPVLRSICPAVAGSVLAHLFFQILQFRQLHIPLQILRFRAAGSHQLNGVVRIERHAFQIDPVVGAHGDKALLVHFGDGAGHADGIKAVFVQIRKVLIFFGHDNVDLIPFRDALASRTALQLFVGEIHQGIGCENDVVYRDYEHVLFLRFN